MHSAFMRLLALPGFLAVLLFPAHVAAQNGGDFSTNTQAKKLPEETILVKGAWSSASDSLAPLPEGGRVAMNAYTNSYFALDYTLPPGWMEKYTGPPPSDSGHYVLAQIRTADSFKGTSRGSLLITAQDLFFSRAPAENALELVNLAKDSLSADYKMERAPTIVRIADRSFVRFDYASPIAELHWHVLTTQIRCHMVQFVFTDRDTELTDTVMQGLDKMTLPLEAGPISGRGGGDVPVCIKDYVRDENVIEKVDPVFAQRRFNPVPIRVIIDKEGKVKHIHFLSSFPDQAKAISDALSQWRFKPYLRNGKPVEVETGIMFGRASRPIAASATAAVSE